MIQYRVGLMFDRISFIEVINSPQKILLFVRSFFTYNATTKYRIFTSSLTGTVSRPSIETIPGMSTLMTTTS
jgi:hypothetical protein